MEANFIGAALGVTATYFLGAQPLIIGIVVMLVIIINLWLKFEDSLALSIVTVIAVMETSTGNYLYFAGNRFLLTVIGVFSAALVNAVFI
ncbi:aromatic acid exporter family protein, partial [Acinetobacter baumannii]|uniref:aromatic acid exporter family protein n=1 Tax=Acinetobacter baumannii TaxID=470 RepID=UPI001F0B25B6